MVRGRSGLTPQEEQLKKIIAANIKKYLLKNNKKAAELQRGTSISQSSVSEYINGKTLPSAGNTQKIADYFGVLKSDIDPRYKGGYSLEDCQRDQIKTNSSIIEETIKSMKTLTPEQQAHLLKLSKLDLDNTIVDTAEIMAKADEVFRDKVFSYADYEYFKYLKELEEKNTGNRNSAS